MKYTDTVIIGGGQAGLAMSRCLWERGVKHVLLERGKIGERWRSERWDSLQLLTPNWQSRLPHWHYQGDDPDGYMTMPELIATNGKKLVLNSPSRQSIVKRMAATAMKRARKYGDRTIPMLMNMRMFSTSVIALDIRFPVWLRSWNRKLRCWTRS